MTRRTVLTAEKIGIIITALHGLKKQEANKDLWNSAMDIAIQTVRPLIGETLHFLDGDLDFAIIRQRHPVLGMPLFYTPNTGRQLRSPFSDTEATDVLTTHIFLRKIFGAISDYQKSRDFYMLPDDDRKIMGALLSFLSLVAFDYQERVVTILNSFMINTDNKEIVDQLIKRVAQCNGKLSAILAILEPQITARKFSCVLFEIKARPAIGYGHLYHNLRVLIEAIKAGSDLADVVLPQLTPSIR